MANAGSWDTVGLCSHSLQRLSQLNFTQMTPVQASTIPLFITSKDVVVEAVTGSGKTLAFVLPMIEHVQRQSFSKSQIGGLIISPTRELAVQIHNVLADMLPETLNSVLLTSGQSNEQVQFKAGCIVVGTPGRLHDAFVRSPSGDLKQLQMLVLDEADLLLDLGFEQTITAIIHKLPKQRRTGLFSATMTDGVQTLIKAGLRNPVKVVVKVQNNDSEIIRTPTTLDIGYILCGHDQKLAMLIKVIETASKSIVFFCSCAGVDYFWKVLAAHPLLCKRDFFSFHGKMTPEKRTLVYGSFVSSHDGVLLCTDVAARGLDLPDVETVIQFDPPTDPKAFAHRCGRTGRLGRSGNAIILLDPSEDTFVNFLHIRKVPSKEVEEPVETEFVSDTRIWCQQLSLSDRDIYEKGVRAFVAFIRSYSAHQLYSIFRLKDLDFGKLANAYGLLLLPRMPELKGRNTHSFHAPAKKFELDLISYKDKAREKARQLKLKGPKKEKVFKKKNVAWSLKKEKLAKRNERKQKKEAKEKIKLESMI